MYQYLKYYNFLRQRWNRQIAKHIIVHEWRGEQEYGINTMGADELTSMERAGVDISHATLYMPAPYDLLEKVFYRFNIASFHHLIDIGCGKGRTLCVAAHFGCTKLTGVDFSHSLCAAASRNLQKVKKRLPGISYEIVLNDAFYFTIPPTADGIFLFNPFDEIILSGVVQNIETSLRKKPRTIQILYFNPAHKQVFLDNGFHEIYHFKTMRYLEVSVLEKKGPQP